MKNMVILIFYILLNKIMAIYFTFFYILPTDKNHNPTHLKNKKISCNNKVNYLPNVIF